MTGRAAWLGPLVERPFRLLWIGQTASAAGNALVFVAVAFAVLKVGGSAGDLGIVFAAFTAARLLLVLAGGVWADRLPRQFVMVACDVASGIAEVILALLLLSGTAQVWHVAVGAAVIGAASAFRRGSLSGRSAQALTSWGSSRAKAGR